MTLPGHPQTPHLLAVLEELERAEVPPCLTPAEHAELADLRDRGTTLRAGIVTRATDGATLQTAADYLHVQGRTLLRWLLRDPSLDARPGRREA